MRIVGVPRRVIRQDGGSHREMRSALGGRIIVQRTTGPLDWEGEQKPMEGQGARQTAATPISSPVVFAEQGLEVEGSRVAQA
jgi:hypothetical protein